MRWVLMLLTIFVVAGLTWGISQYRSLRGQGTGGSADPQSSDIFTPGHASVSLAVRHFFGLMPEPVQPLAYTHQVHIEKAQLQCVFCHEGVETGPVASIPSINKCMTCHENMPAEKPALQQLLDYQKKGQDIPWQRVYGWPEESHVRFNHAPHIRAQVGCTTCHGDVAKMTVAERVVDHKMSFCVDCHKEKKASNDCLTCHY